MLIALLGVYGVVSCAMIERTREIGIRMALGASRDNVLVLMLRQGMRLIVLGAIPGTLLAFAVAQGLTSRILYKTSNSDPITYASVALLIAAAGLLASFLPARKAASLQPAKALRYE